MARISIKLTNGGMTSDGFTTTPNLHRSLVHFDPVTLPNTLQPNRSTVSGDANASTDQIGVFEVANSGKLYGLSLASGNTQKLFFRTDPTDASSTWTSPSGASVANVPDGKCFVEYKKVGKLFWSLLSGNIASYAYGSATYAANASAITATGQGIVHSKDDILYVPCANVIAANNNDSWNTSALTLPSYFTITAICEYGNYLAIACAPASGYGKSIVFLWDRDTSLATVAESIDWGYGNIQILEQIDGVLIGISFETINTIGARITFRSYAGAPPQVFETLYSTTQFTIGDLPQWRQKFSNFLYFMLTITLNGTKLQGIWRVSRPAPGKPFTISLDYLPNGDAGLTAGTLNGFYRWGDYMFISYVSSSTYGLSKTTDQPTYSNTSYLETTVNPGVSLEDYFQLKQLTYFQVATNNLASGQQVVAKYRVDGGSWKTIFTKTVSSPNADAAAYGQNRDSSGQFDEGTNYEFRIESTGGAIITGYTWAYNVIAQQQ